jgi:hypothetical protein
VTNSLFQRETNLARSYHPINQCENFNQWMESAQLLLFLAMQIGKKTICLLWNLYIINASHVRFEGG